MIQEIFSHNRNFVANKEYEKFATDKYPNKRIAIVTCMDTRLVELLPAALGIRNGDVKMIKNAGGMITDPFDSTMRSILLAIYELKVNEIMIIGHTQCGVEGMEASEMKELMMSRGVKPETISLIERCGIDLNKWLTGFDDTDTAVRDTVDLVKNHPLMPSEGINVAGYVIDSYSGELRHLKP